MMIHIVIWLLIFAVIIWINYRNMQAMGPGSDRNTPSRRRHHRPRRFRQLGRRLVGGGEEVAAGPGAAAISAVAVLQAAGSK